MKYRLTTERNWDGEADAWAALQGKVMHFGIFANAVYPDGTPVALVAAAQEFGDGENLPARSFLRSTYDENKEPWAKLVAAFMKQNGPDGRGALDFLGQQAVATVIQKIESNIAPALKPETVRRKTRANIIATPELALVFSGKLTESMGWEVEDNGNGS